MSDIQKQVEGIVETLENPESNYCPSCECEVELMGDDESCKECGDIVGPMSGFDYLNDALDIEYIISSDRKYLGARVLVCFGGPNVWVDTRYMRVDGHWWADSYNAAFTDNIGIDDVCQELWECGA
jgi:hypothetical protein